MGDLNPRSAHVTGQILAVLHEAGPLPMSTRQVEDATGSGQLAYRMLQRLARRGEVEKITLPGMPSRYWRLDPAAPPP